MLVYGDHQERADPRGRASEINRALAAIEALPAGIDRHARLVAVLDHCGRLLQGLADAAFDESQCDTRAASTAALESSVLGLAAAVCRSWDSAFQRIGKLPRIEASREWPIEVELRTPEGFAYYAVYPEAYVEAARRLNLAAPPRVIGIRSIGTSLAAVVAAALGAGEPVTVRPIGHPAARAIAVDPSLERELLEGECHYVIVDEGPGQSGSSFGAVADWLQERGIPLDRIALLPSHSGLPGSAASVKRRRWWNEVQRIAADFGPQWPELLRRWCTDLLGPIDDAPLDISAGTWRRLVYRDERDWPAAVATWERRKYLLQSAGGERFIAKFAGLGAIGEDKLAIARSLYSERFVPEPIALVHGFLVERWHDDASPIAGDDEPLAEIARYIGTRARLLAASSASGATAEELLAMIRRNVSLEFGSEWRQPLERWSSRISELDRRIVRVRTDGKLERPEWLRTKAGALIKADALDHHQAHDLIGCQDLAWDVAGALAEFDVDQRFRSGFTTSVEHWASRELDPELLEFYRLAYSAFRLGQCRLGEGMTFEISEQQRLKRAAERYSAQLQHLLEFSRPATRLTASVD